MPNPSARTTPRLPWHHRWRQWTGSVDWLLLAGIVLVTLFLLPARFAALRADDTWVAETRGQVLLAGMNLPEYLWLSSRNAIEAGRPVVGGVVQGVTVAWIMGNHRVAYHVILIVLTAVAAGVLYAFVRGFGLPPAGALLVTVVLAGALQMRSYHDPLLGYWGTMQLLLVLLLASLIVFHRALERDSTRLLWLSVVVYFPSLLLYEGAYSLVAVFLAVALFARRGTAALRACLPFLSLALAFVGLAVYLRATANFVPEGYEVGTSPLAILRTYVVQLLSPLPASNLLFKADYFSFLPLGGMPTLAEAAGSAWRGLIVFALVLLLSLRLARSGVATFPPDIMLGRLAILGGLLWVTAGVATALSPKYQVELVPGKNHLPALVEVFGWALVATAAVLALVRVASRRSAVAVWAVAVLSAAVIGLGAGLTGLNNLRVVGLEVPVAETRDLLEQAAADGVFGSLPDRATLIFANEDMYWQTGNLNQFPIALEGMLVDRTGRRLDGRIVEPEQRFDCRASNVFPPEECASPTGAAAWVRVRARPGGGSVIVAELPSRTRQPWAATTRRLRVYAREDGGHATAPPLVGTTPFGEPWSSQAIRWRRVHAGGGHAIFEARVPPLRASTIDDPTATVSFTDPTSPEQIVRIYGAQRLLP